MTSLPDSQRPGPAEDDLHRWVDGRLDAAGRARVDTQLGADPALREQAAVWQSQRDQLQALHAGVADEAVPPAMLSAVRAAEATRARARRGWQAGAIAASVVVAFSAGWLGHGAWRNGPAGAGDFARRFSHDAAVAHAVFTPEVRHPVEVGAAQQEHLVQWLSKRLGRPLKVPTLQAQGYELVGGRLLPGSGDARAQFMYQNAAGQRLTLYIGVTEAKATQETAFRFMDDAGVPRFYWVDGGMGYALAGTLGRTQLLQVAETVYRQLEPAAAPGTTGR